MKNVRREKSYDVYISYVVRAYSQIKKLNDEIDISDINPIY